MTFYDRFRTSVLENGNSLLYTLGMTAKCATNENQSAPSLLAGMKGGQQKSLDGKLMPGQAPPSAKKTKKRRKPVKVK